MYIVYFGKNHKNHIYNIINHIYNIIYINNAVIR